MVAGGVVALGKKRANKGLDVGSAREPGLRSLFPSLKSRLIGFAATAIVVFAVYLFNGFRAPAFADLGWIFANIAICLLVVLLVLLVGGLTLDRINWVRMSRLINEFESSYWAVFPCEMRSGGRRFYLGRYGRSGIVCFGDDGLDFRDARTGVESQSMPIDVARRLDLVPASMYGYPIGWAVKLRRAESDFSFSVVSVNALGMKRYLQKSELRDVVSLIQDSLPPTESN